MKISEIKKWAKDHGYTVIKDTDDDDTATYYWYKNDNEDICGIEPSVSKVARAVYNHMTDNKWVEYQQEYDQNKDCTIDRSLE